MSNTTNLVTNNKGRLPKRTLIFGLVAALSGLALFVTLKSARGQSDTEPPETPPWFAYNQLAGEALDAEEMTLSAVADLPTPLPKPVAARLSSIADSFQRLEHLVVIARSLRLRAALGDGLPEPSSSVLNEQAAQVGREALRLALGLKGSIDGLPLSSTVTDPLHTQIQTMIDQIALTPIQLP